jgi:hypothetical protein
MRLQIIWILAILLLAPSATAGAKPGAKRTCKDANDGKSPDKPEANAPRQDPGSPTAGRRTLTTTPDGQQFVAFEGKCVHAAINE